jgi:hypothetical protein
MFEFGLHVLILFPHNNPSVIKILFHSKQIDSCFRSDFLLTCFQQLKLANVATSPIVELSLPMTKAHCPIHFPHSVAPNLRIRRQRANSGGGRQARSGRVRSSPPTGRSLLLFLLLALAQTGPHRSEGADGHRGLRVSGRQVWHLCHHLLTLPFTHQPLVSPCRHPIPSHPNCPHVFSRSARDFDRDAYKKAVSVPIVKVTQSCPLPRFSFPHTIHVEHWGTVGSWSGGGHF